MTKQTKAKLIHQAIADDIVHGRLAPGTALDETVIAATFGVSRTPIREAIRQLEAIGLVSARARRGAVVARLSDKQLDDMFAVMAELEALCARWSAVNMTASERRHLLALQQESERLVSAGRREVYVDFNNRFHDAIYHGAHNGFLAELALTVRQRCAPFRRAQFETLGRLAKSHAEHGAVVTAIQRGDADAAATRDAGAYHRGAHRRGRGRRRSGPAARAGCARGRPATGGSAGAADHGIAEQRLTIQHNLSLCIQYRQPPPAGPSPIADLLRAPAGPQDAAGEKPNRPTLFRNRGPTRLRSGASLQRSGFWHGGCDGICKGGRVRLRTGLVSLKGVRRCHNSIFRAGSC